MFDCTSAHSGKGLDQHILRHEKKTQNPRGVALRISDVAFVSPGGTRMIARFGLIDHDNP